MRSNLYSILILLAVLVTTGCASKVRDTGFLSEGYESFNVVDSDSVKIRMDENFRQVAAETPNTVQPIRTALGDSMTTRAVVFIVEPTKWTAKVDPFLRNPERRESLEFTVRERLYRYLLREFPHPTRVRYAYMQSDPLAQNCRVITITSNITDQKSGVGPLRYFFGWGLGKSRLQLEGEIYEGPARERKIGEYAIRRAHGGYAQNGLNVKVFKADYCMRYAAEEAVMELTSTLAENIRGVSEIPVGGAAFIANSQQSVPPLIGNR